jgi:hypothetical protein
VLVRRMSHKSRTTEQFAYELASGLRHHSM